MKLLRIIHFLSISLSLNPMNIVAPLATAYATELTVPKWETENSESSHKGIFPITVSSNVTVGGFLDMRSQGVISENGHVMGSTLTSITSPVGAPCGGVFVIPKAGDGSSLGRYKMSAPSTTSMPFCVHGVLTSPNDPHIRNDSWSGDIPEEIIKKTTSADLIQACLSNCR